MKKILSFFVLFAGMAQFTACSDNETSNPYAHQSTITIEKAEVTFDANGGTGSVQVSSPSAVSVSVPTEFKWVAASASGNTINVTVESNPGIEGRSARLAIKNASDEIYVTVSQTGLVSRLSDYQMYFSDEASVQALAYKHDVPVNVQSLSDWIRVQLDDENNRLLVAVASNDDETARLGLVAISSGNVKDTLAIVQNGMVFNLEKTALKMDGAGGIESVNIEHSKPVTVQSAVDWIECVFNDKTNILTLSIDENPGELREGIVAVMSGNSTKTITITQESNDTTTTEPTEPEEDTLFGTYTFYFVYNEKTYNLGNFSIEEYTGKDAEEGDVLIKDFYVPGNEIYGFVNGEKLYIYAYQPLGILNDPTDGDYGNFLMSVSDQDLIEFDITPDGIVSADLCIMATDPGYTQGWWWEIPQGGTSVFVKAEAAARTTHRAAVKDGFKVSKSRKNLPTGFKLYHK